MRSIRFCFVVLCLFLSGCSQLKMGQEDLDAADYMTAPDLEYEIVTGKDVPQRVHERIFHKQKERFGFTYRDDDTLYIAFGFGTMPTGGYSIQIKAVKDTQTKIVVEASVIAPQPEEVVSDNESYPVMILKVTGNQKNVQFRLSEES